MTREPTVPASPDAPRVPPAAPLSAAQQAADPAMAVAPAAEVRAGPYPEPAADARLVVFDFDHTLYDGDSGSHLIAWLLKRNPLRLVAALLASVVLGPMTAWLPTRRRGISGYIWIATLGLPDRRTFERRIDRYVAANQADMRRRLLPTALEVLRKHRAAGDRVVVATGAPPELARAALAFVAHEDVPVLGTLLGPRYGAVITLRHCHAEEKMRMLRERGFGDIAIAYSDSSADLPLLLAAKAPVVVNPKAASVEKFRQRLPKGTPILNWGCTSRAGDPVA